VDVQVKMVRMSGSVLAIVAVLMPLSHLVLLVLQTKGQRWRIVLSKIYFTSFPPRIKLFYPVEYSPAYSLVQLEMRGGIGIFHEPE
jgi:hypothetical protein